MPTSLVKFFNKCETESGKKLFWDRADIDGYPFRGPVPPMFTEEEYEQRVVRVADAKNGFFDVSDPEQNKKYLEIIDACCNGWFKCLYIERFWQNTTKHYIEWVEFYMEDGSRIPYYSPVNGYRYDGGFINNIGNKNVQQ